MKLPFVSRWAYEALAERLDAANHTAQASSFREHEWQTRHDVLMADFMALAKKQTPDAPTIKPRERDEVIEAIMARAGNNGAIRSHLASWAMNQRRAGTPDETIVQQVLVWASPDDATEGVP